MKGMSVEQAVGAESVDGIEQDKHFF